MDMKNEAENIDVQADVHVLVTGHEHKDSAAPPRMLMEKYTLQFNASFSPN